MGLYHFLDYENENNRAISVYYGDLHGQLHISLKLGVQIVSLVCLLNRRCFSRNEMFVQFLGLFRLFSHCGYLKSSPRLSWTY